jgi:hypothetical protein
MASRGMATSGTFGEREYSHDNKAIRMESFGPSEHSGKVGSPAGEERFRVEVQGSRGFGNGHKSAAAAVDSAPPFDSAALG